ncbi:2-octaprenyl-6-methoxyphenyl hydroxylase [Psychromonas marina]|uniref:2-octaprenyl-6-methoxyphenyl hydroxylase n=1 Tax=Psychromonas marina TaxID=88364 RepID=A0ABQ6E4G5_9GAMM|nr:2-octaprenyl-6-methoxyphenyl hydroxylase [Psychromonas marina]GLS92294.1 2-octaprenyl-6-methoxyphenyl hydroxylase [Psychromonas marina]
MSKTTEQYLETDIIIVGAGMAGCLQALAIAKKSPTIEIILIDNNPEQLQKGAHPGFDARSIALSAGSCQLLEQLGLWSAIAQSAQPIDDIHISDRHRLGIVDLEPPQSGQPFGYVVELQNVGMALQQQLALYPQIKRFYNSALINTTKQVDHIVCELSGDRSTQQYIKTKLCIAADGANSHTNQLLSIHSTQSDYGCSAVIANISVNKTHQNRAYERFTEAGPLALLPLSDNRYSLVWSIKNSDLNALLELDEQGFLDKLQQAFGFRAGIFMKAGRRDSYPLKLSKADRPITHRGVAIGNAAHCLHPVMGQGFNLGMRDLSVLAGVIAQLDDIKQLGEFSMLDRYWLARQRDHNTTITMTDSIVRIFSNNDWPLVLGRTIALQAISLFPSLGTPIVKQAKGQFNLFISENKKS